MRVSRSVLLVLVVPLAFATTACTTLGVTPDEKPAAASLDDETWDPFEPFNRAMFTFNEKFDQWLLKPVAKGYDWVMPGLAKQGVSNFFSNLIQPRVALNDLLQGKFTQSARDTGRFLVNSTAGVLGFVDIASLIGLEPKEEDWGQTFAVWGMGNGPYFVWPIIGPRYARDTLGVGLDWLSSPITYVNPPAASWGLWGLDIVDIRTRYLPAEKVLDQAMGDDKYTFIREAYRQRRRNLIYDGNPPKPSFFEDEPEIIAPQPAPATEPAASTTPPPAEGAR